MSIKILLADDHQIIRDGLKSLLEKEEEMLVVGEANNGKKAVEMASELDPDLIIMDVSMPDLNGIEATKQILKSSDNHIKIIALSMYSDKRYVSSMLQAGATGYLLKDCAFAELSNAINTVMGGKTYLSPGIAEVVVQNYIKGEGTSTESGPVKLTSRETQVLKKIAEGMSTKEIAFSMHVSIKTVESHRRQIMKKLETNSIASLTKYAIRTGLIDLES